MKLAISVESGADDQLIFAQQLGAEQVYVETVAAQVAALVNRIDKVGIELVGCGPAPSGHAQTVEGMCQWTTAAGKAGIFQVHLGWEGSETAKRVIRVAEDAGVRVAWQLSESPDHALAVSTSAFHGLDLCLGLGATTDDAVKAIDAGGDSVFSVLLANHLQAEPCPLDEGVIEIPVVLRTLLEHGFSGAVRAVPGPPIVGDTAWGHKRRAFDLGYIRAVMQAIG